MNFEYKKKAFPYMVTTLAGLVLAMFGVFLSVFADSSGYERIVTVLVVLIIYGILGIAIGLWKPAKTLFYLLCLSMPGVLVLLSYMYNEGFNVFYVPYMILIITFSYLGLNSGKYLKTRKNK